MKNRSQSFLAIFVLILLSVAVTASLSAQQILPAGTVVFAEWSENSWFHGRIQGTCGEGYDVLYDDNDTKCCTPGEIIVDVVPARDDVVLGAAVLAQWGTGRFYPGVVSSVNKGSFDIRYDDGYRSTVTLEQIRLRGNHGAAGPGAIAGAMTAPAATAAARAASTEARTTVKQEMDLWHDGSSWAEITPDGRVWIDGSRIGEITPDGEVYYDGSYVGEVERNGTIWVDGSSVGEVEMNGRIWRDGSSIGEIVANGDIWLDGSRWGEEEPFVWDYSEIRVVAAILAFFAPDFGFLE